MLKRILLPMLVLVAFSLIVYPSLVRSQKKTVPKEDSSCYPCHELIKSLKDGNKEYPS